MSSLYVKKYKDLSLIPGISYGVRRMGDYRCRFIAAWWLWYKVELLYGLQWQREQEVQR